MLIRGGGEMVSIEQLQKINTPIEQVYAALVTEEGLGNIWTTSLSVSEEAGAINSFYFGGQDHVVMKVTELTPNQKISWECLKSEAEPEWIGTTVTFHLRQQANQTIVEFSHLGWKSVTSCYRYCNHNWAMFLLSLKQYCELGQGNPYQA